MDAPGGSMLLRRRLVKEYCRLGKGVLMEDLPIEKSEDQAFSKSKELPPFPYRPLHPPAFYGITVRNGVEYAAVDIIGSNLQILTLVPVQSHADYA